MIDALMQVTTSIAAAVVLMRAEPAIARMQPATNILVRIAMVALTVGAVALLGSIALMEHVPSLTELLLSSGCAALLICERRVRVLVSAHHHRRKADQS